MTEQAATPPITILGCGNLNRSDDGVGVICARELSIILAPEIAAGKLAVFDTGTAGFEVMYRMRGTSSLFVIDACRSGSEPGAVFEVPGSEVELKVDPGVNLHAFRWDHALWVGRQIHKDAFPKEVLVFLIEAESLELGLELSPPVRDAVAHVVSRIQSRIRPTICARRGNLYFDQHVVERFFGGVEAVAITQAGEESALWVMPIMGAGGLLLKQRNSKGDRVVQATELLEALNIKGESVDVAWDSERAGLLVRWEQS